MILNFTAIFHSPFPNKIISLVSFLCLIPDPQEKQGNNLIGIVFILNNVKNQYTEEFFFIWIEWIVRSEADEGLPYLTVYKTAALLFQNCCFAFSKLLLCFY
jgi:hypothetical protein